MSAPDRVVVEAPSRLHFGVLDLRGALGRRFGGLGAAVPAPSLLLEAERATELTASGPEADRAAEFARRFAEYHARKLGARLTVHRALPAHAGLGSGTQLGLSVARALAELHGLPTDVAGLARAVGRGERSAIGTWAFELGGFLVEGGRRDGSDAVAPLLGRYAMPTAWRCVIVVPDDPRGLSGEAEVAAFRGLPPPETREVERVSHLVLMQLLPALVEADLASFGAALSEVQRITGGWFAPMQGGTFASGAAGPLIACLASWGAAGVGQSSWGPAVYGIVAGDEAAEALAAQARRALGGRGAVYAGAFASSGARVTTGDAAAGTD